MKSVLLVDDEPHVLRIMKLSLEKAGYAVVTAPNGVVALKRLREEPHPDVLVTDIDMPKMRGDELCRHIVEEFPGRSFVIFVVTSRAETEHRDWAGSIDRLGFLEKPLSIRKLQAVLHAHFAD